MNEAKSNDSGSPNGDDPTLSNDPVFLNQEIEALHSRIYHLRRTNNMIRKEYAEDPDCIQALHENLVIVERKLNALFVYFKLYRHITRKAHSLTKFYKSDLQYRDKMERSQRERAKQQHQLQGQETRKLKEYDLDFVAQRLREKGKELKENGKGSEALKSNSKQKRKSEVNKPKSKETTGQKETSQ